MAKKKSGKAVNKSAAIRESLAKNPEATNSEVMAELAKKGITVTSAQVSTIRSGLKKKTAKKRPASPKRRGVKKKRTVRKKASRKKRTTTSKAGADDTVTIAELEKASAFLKAVGDVERAITLVKAVSKLQS